MKYKVGDKVKIVSNSKAFNNKIGAFEGFHTIHSGLVCVIIEGKSMWFNYSQIRKLTKLDKALQ